ncbi:MAG: B12-binding domain-containing radical SAM protein, partial [Nannocystaceae bacterium]
MHPLLNVALMGHSSSHEEFTYAFGLYRLKAYCEQLGLPHALTVFDRASDDDEDEDFALLCKHAPDVIGLSAYIWSLPRVVRLVSRLRQALPEVLIVVGGPSASGFEELAIDASRPDLLVIGFGERTFANILTTYAAGELDARIEEVGDLISHRGEHPIRYRLARPAEDLDAYPSPYLLGMIDPKGRSTLYIETDRGCPYSCAFCIESTAPN